MKIFLIIILTTLSSCLYAQILQINNPANTINNDDRQFIAHNNQQKIINPQIIFERNTHTFDLPQMSKSKSKEFQASTRSFSSGASSEVAVKSRSQKVIKRTSLKNVTRPLNKKVKIHLHYKKKNHIKRCASF